MESMSYYMAMVSVRFVAVEWAVPYSMMQD